MKREYDKRFDKTVRQSVEQKITSRNPVVNEIIRPGAMRAEKIDRLNRNANKKATGWLSDSRNK